MSSDSEDDFVTYGTPLDPLKEDEIPKKKPCLVEDQIVTDKQGRRRFHGAFTGGFSAGFFNTVGSLEGWKPSSFKSSRAQKQKISQQKPEDYMDEEDTGEFGIAPIILKTRKDYMNETRKSDNSYTKGLNLGTFVFKNLLKPVRETVGVRLLKKMGWKPGQGVGPRINKQEKKKAVKLKEKVYGCVLPPGQVEEADSDSYSESEWDEIKYAPQDYELFLNLPKDNFFGIGYKGLEKKSILGSFNLRNCGESYDTPSKNLKIRGQAFGVGAFEDDDEDIYSKEDLSQYDFSLPSSNQIQEEIVKKNRKFEGVLEGFKPQLKRSPKKYYPLPTIPKNFNVNYKVRVSRFDNVDNKDCSLKKKNKLASEERAVLLEEPTTKLSSSESSKLLPTPLPSSTEVNLGFKPFCHDQSKQNRYEQYLKLVESGKKEELYSLQPVTMTAWDKEREKMEFDQAAKLFKPLSGLMKERFTPASQPDDISDPLAVVERFHGENEERAKAAKMNLYGKLTRIIEDWVPCSLLCKRFNVPEPYESHQQNPVKIKKKKFLFDSIDFSKDVKEIHKEFYSDIPSSPIKSQNPENNKVVDSETKDTVEIQKAEGKVQDINVDFTKSKVDIFKEIFLDSDNESDKEEKIVTEQNEEMSYEEAVFNTKRNTSPPRGIFENIDFTALNERETIVKTKSISDSVKDNINNKIEVPVVDCDFNASLIYGPKIPDKIKISLDQPSVQDSLQDTLWIEKEISSKKTKKKSKKNKKLKSKHKHKKHKKKDKS